MNHGYWWGCTPASFLLSAVSAAGSLVLARKSEKRELTEASADMAGVGVAEGEAQELPGDRR